MAKSVTPAPTSPSWWSARSPPTCDAGHRSERHAHDWHQLIYASAGVLNVWTERGSWVVPPHWASGCPRTSSIRSASPANSALRTLYLTPGWCDGLPAECGAVTVSPLLRELILRATRDGMLDRREPADAALARLIVDEFRQIGRAALRPAAADRPGDPARGDADRGRRAGGEHGRPRAQRRASACARWNGASWPRPG